MRIIAKKNLQSDLPESLRKYAFNQYKGTLPLTIGKKYVVSGLRKTLGHTFYLIVYDDIQWYPWWYPAELFEVEDDTIPEDWIKGGNQEDEYLTFPELAQDRDEGGWFASNLEDGDKAEMEIFLKYFDRYSKAYADD